MTNSIDVYPYIPNSVPEVKARMLAAIGANSMEELYAEIPPELRMQRPLSLPEPFLSEHRLKRHVQSLLAKNKSCAEALSFLGGGCYQHHVPAVCDEINGRSEFLTAYAGEPYDDAGRFQALFEYASMLGEMLEMDVVSIPTFDGHQAAATAVRMAGRHTGRKVVLVAEHVSPDKYSVMQNYGRSDLEFRRVPFDLATGTLDMGRLASILDEQVACLFLDNPSYLGVIQDGPAIAAAVHAFGALLVVGVDPSCLGVIAPPSSYGADIVCGDIQSLGMHMSYGGGHGGFIATQDDEALVMQYPSRLFGIAPTKVPGEYGFGDVAYSRTSFDKRENGNEFVGTAAALWGITAGVYMALMGPQGMRDLAHTIICRNAYAKQQLASVTGVRIPHAEQVHFKEFVVNFDASGKSVQTINRALLEQGIFGGHDLSHAFPVLGQCALYSFTEVHSQEDVATLCAALATILTK
ncbi:MAG: aminomethyl-transferring glycine dehydrogenase subunit GcvPA [Sulfuriferula multivorans]|uniref:Aminomethyl-transferring glycine dehydrogenase subunit GcvPA n=1 Tax=Sulfuriferula multivorans TaxID=1559896 RepID=A0A7C9NR70_9PROT|nr:aminomethyl-transferring glycine dehydrogenase subunit GcvPA [Sulfuriferula multivorans]